MPETMDRNSNNKHMPAESSNYHEDMKIVQKLLKKYSANSDEKLRVYTAGHAHVVIDAPTDAWFHRHTGKYRKSDEKSDLKVADKKSNLPQQKNSTRVPTVPSKKTNRVHFKNPSVDEATEKYRLMRLKVERANIVSIGNGGQPTERDAKTKDHIQSVGKLSEKIKFWETSK